MVRLFVVILSCHTIGQAHTSFHASWTAQLGDESEKYEYLKELIEFKTNSGCNTC